MRKHQLALTVAAVFATLGTAHAATEIQFWHSMEGALGDRVNELVENFNKTQTEYVVVPSYKGTYGESMNAGIAAFRTGNAPDILQVFEVGTATMMGAKGAVEPIEQLSEKVGKPIKADDFLGAVAGYYSSTDGKLISMPFNSSTAIFYYNKDAFKKAGLDVNKPPKTWQEVAEAGAKLREAGYECGYTTSWPSWILLENFAAWHNIPYASDNNGFDGPQARLKLDDPLFAKHINFLNDMSKDGTFTYGGRGDTANSLFTTGKCGMFTGSSASRANIVATGEFDLGMSSLPYYDDVQGAPQNSIIGGASLWVFAKRPAEVEKGVVEFFNFLASPEQAAIWHQETGYVPVTKGGYETTKATGYYDKNPGTDVAITQLSADTTDNSRGIRLGFLPQIRDIEEGLMEQIFAGKVSVEEGLKAMQTRGDELLQRFEKSQK